MFHLYVYAERISSIGFIDGNLFGFRDVRKEDGSCYMPSCSWSNEKGLCSCDMESLPRASCCADSSATSACPGSSRAYSPSFSEREEAGLLKMKRK